MKRTLRLVLACVCLLAFLVTECNADCGGSRLGKRIQSGLSRVAGAPAKVRQAVQSSRATNCSASVPAAPSCSAPVMSCSAPQVAPVASVEPMSVPMVVPVSAPVFAPDMPEPAFEQPAFEPVMQCTSGTCTVQETSKAFQPIRNSVAQYKADVQARNGRMQHIGGSFGSGRFEGVGFSTVSADEAIKACCYYGQKTPVDIGVSRGENGWYATVLYR